MPCYHPITGYRAKKPNPGTGKRSIVFNSKDGFADLKVTLPCGRCIGCRLQYSLEYAARAHHEMKLHPVGCSITLTYDDEHLPPNKSLVKRHPQLFMKSLREKYAPRKIRAFGCGEYGEKTGRPHYHICLFNFDFADKVLYGKTPQGHDLYTSEDLRSLWPHGDHKIGELNFETAAYAARYMTKKIKGHSAKAHYGDRIPEYAIKPMRPGLGADYAKKWLTEIYTNDSIIVEKMGQKVEISPPKFYDKILEKTDPVLYAYVMAKRRAEMFKLKDHPDSTDARLKTRRIVHELKAKQLKRTIE